MPSRRNPFVDLAVSNGLVGALGLVRNTVLAAILGPLDFGFYLLLQAVVLWLGLAHGGLFTGLIREMPYRAGSAKATSTSDRRLLVATASTGGVGLTIAMGALALVPIAILWPRNTASNQQILIVLLLFLALVAALGVDGLLQNAARGTMALGAVATAGVSQAALRLLTTLVLVPPFGLPGAIAADIITRVTSSAVLAWKVRAPLRPSWSQDHARALMRAGLPITIVAAGQIGLITIDRFVTAAILGSLALGEYGLAIIAATAMVAAVAAVGTVMLPHFSRMAGENESRPAVSRRLRIATRMALQVTLSVSAAFIATLPFLTQWGRFRSFTPGVNAAFILLTGLTLLGLASPSITLLNAFNQARAVIGLQASLLAASALLSGLLAGPAGLGLEGISLGSAIAISVYAVGAYVLATRQVGVGSMAARELIGAGVAVVVAGTGGALMAVGSDSVVIVTSIVLATLAVTLLFGAVRTSGWLLTDLEPAAQ